MKCPRTAVTVTLLALAFACARAPVPQSYEIVRPDLDPFRTAFNAASGHVRAVLLVGPT